MADRRPGVILYFDDLRSPLEALSDDQCGRLLRAIVSYAERGVIETELDPVLKIVFGMIKPKLDRDDERYTEGCTQRRYATYCREARKRGEQVLTFTEWRLAHLSELSGRIGPLSDDVGPYPSTTTTTIPTTTTAPTTIPSTSTTAIETPSITAMAAGEGFRGRADEVNRLHCEWGQAMAMGEKARAFEISNALFRKGYTVDIETGEMKPR